MELAKPSHSVMLTTQAGKPSISPNGRKRAKMKNGSQQAVNAVIITPSVIDALRSLSTDDARRLLNAAADSRPLPSGAEPEPEP